MLVVSSTVMNLLALRFLPIHFWLISHEWLRIQNYNETWIIGTHAPEATTPVSSGI